MGKEEKGVIRVQNFDYSQSLSDWKIWGMTRDWAQIKIDPQSNPCHKSFTHEVRGQETLRPRPKVYSIVLICFIIEMNDYQQRSWGQTDKHKPVDTFVRLDSPLKFGSWENNAASTTKTAPTISQPLFHHFFLLFGIAVAISSK